MTEVRSPITGSVWKIAVEVGSQLGGRLGSSDGPRDPDCAILPVEHRLDVLDGLGEVSGLDIDGHSTIPHDVLPISGPSRAFLYAREAKFFSPLAARCAWS